MAEKKTTKKATNYLPYNEDAEKAVLGSALLKQEALFNVLSALDENDFYVGKHQIIYRVIKNLMEKKQAVDVLTVTEELINIKELENIRGVDYLQECTDSMVAFANLEYYIDIVNNQSVLRNLLIACRDINAGYMEGEIENINDFILSAETKIKEATEKRKISTFKSINEVAEKVKLEIDTMKANDDELTGVTSGYPRINFYTQGFHPGEITIIAARPSVGKTALALNFAYNAAVHSDVTVAIFSLEMTSDLLVKRLIAADSRVSLKKISTGNIEGIERAKVAKAIKNVGESKIYIDDTPGLKLLDIIAKSRKLQASNPDLGLIVVDYLGLVQMSDKKSGGADSRQEEVRKISLALKDMARDLKVPVIVISQLSRSVESRESKKPMLSDLRDSGSIEQDADVVMLLYRSDYYEKENKKVGNKKGGQLTKSDQFDLVRQQKEKELGEEMPGGVSYVEVNIAKNRNGQTGKAGLFFYKEYGKFEAPSEEWEKAMLEVTAGDED